MTCTRNLGAAIAFHWVDSGKFDWLLYYWITVQHFLQFALVYALPFTPQSANVHFSTEIATWHA